MSRRNYSLSNILKNYPLVLVDTCTFQDSLIGKKDKRRETYEEKLKRYGVCSDSYCYWVDRINEHEGILTTQSIFEELSSGHQTTHKYKKKIKKAQRKGGRRDRKKGREALERLRRKRECIKKRNKLIGEIVRHERIVELDDSEQSLFNFLFKQNRHIAEEYGVGISDYDLLINSTVLSQTRENVALITTDFPLIDTHRTLIEKGTIDFSELGCYLRWDIDKYNLPNRPTNR